MTTITQVCKPIPEERRAAYARKVFGAGYPLLVEPVIFAMADMLSPDYSGGMWLYCGICPEGTMYSYPDTDDNFRVVSPNGFECTMSSECRRRSKSEPPCRPNIEPGVEADFELVGCG